MGSIEHEDRFDHRFDQGHRNHLKPRLGNRVKSFPIGYQQKVGPGRLELIRMHFP